jgi:hypothetical protein
MGVDTEHLSFIQGIVARQASNSFLVKGWSLTLCTALVAFSVQGHRPAFGVVAILPCCLFMILDVYYLRQERLFRSLYNKVRTGQCAAPCPRSATTAFCLQTACCRDDTTTWRSALMSFSIWGFHGAVVCALVAVSLALAHG